MLKKISLRDDDGEGKNMMIIRTGRPRETDVTIHREVDARARHVPMTNIGNADCDMIYLVCVCVSVFFFSYQHHDSVSEPN